MSIGQWLKDWSVPLSAGATFLLALAAAWTIWQNYQFRREDKKARYLKEIISWAKEGLNLTERIGRAPSAHSSHPAVWEVITVLSYMEAQGNALLGYSRVFKRSDLEDALNLAVSNVKECLKSYKDAEEMNQRLTKAGKCEGAFIKVLNGTSKIDN